jgi:hypothetical protein
VNALVKFEDGIKEMLAISVERVESDRGSHEEASVLLHTRSRDEALEKVKESSDVVQPDKRHCLAATMLPETVNVVAIKDIGEIYEARAQDRRVELPGVQTIGDIKAPKPGEEKLSELFHLKKRETVMRKQRWKVAVVSEGSQETVDSKASDVTLSSVKGFVHVPRGDGEKCSKSPSLKETRSVRASKDTFAVLIYHSLKEGSDRIDLIGVAAREDRQKESEPSEFAGRASK